MAAAANDDGNNTHTHTGTHAQIGYGRGEQVDRLSREPAKTKTKRE